MTAAVSRLALSARALGRRRRETLFGVALLSPCLVLVMVFFALPLAGILLRSVTDPVVGIDNYIEIFRSRAFRNILGLTFQIAIVTTIGSLLLGFPTAWYLTTIADRDRARLLLLLCTAPLWVAILARLYAWTVILGRRGVINEALIALGITSEPLDLLFNTEAVILGMTHVMLPFMILVLYSAMSRVDPALMEAADSLGARPADAFLRIFLPLVAPGVMAGCLLVLIMSLGFFILPAVLGGGGDITIPIYVQTQIRLFDWGVATAMSMVLLMVTLILFVILTRLFDPTGVLVGGSRR